MSLAKGVTGAVGAGQSADANSANQMVQAQIALNNKATAEQNATWENEMGEYKVAQSGLVGAAKEGALIASQGKSGVDVNSGSNLKVQQVAAQAAQQDTAVAQSDMARKVYGYQVQASNFGNQAAVDEKTAGQYQKAKGLAQFSSLLGGAADAAGSIGKFNWGASGGDAAASDAGANAAAGFFY